MGDTRAGSAAASVDVEAAPPPRRRTAARAAKSATAATAPVARTASGSDDSSAADQGPAGGLTEYERQRAELIARNRERMAQLQLPELAADLAALAERPKRAPAPTQKGVGAAAGRRKRPSALELPPRASRRARGLAPEAGLVLHEGRDGRVTVSAPPPAAGEIGGGAVFAPAAPEPAAPRFVEAPLPFESGNGGPATDAAFLALLRANTGAAAAQEAAPAAGKGRDGGGVMGLRLAEVDVAKMTKTGTTCVAWHPCSGSWPLVASSDKGGRVALWAVDYSPDAADGGGADGGKAEGDGGGGFDGVLSFAPHTEYVSALAWLGRGGGAKLMSASYDGSARLLDAEKGEFLLAPGLPPPADGAEWSAAEGDAEGTTLWLATPTGEASVIDVRAPRAAGSSIRLHDRKINTLDLLDCRGGGQLLASSCSDGTVRIWDARRLGEAGKRAAPVCEVGHAKSSQGAVWAPDGSGRLLSVSFDDTLKVWAPAKADAPGRAMSQALSVRHDNQTGRWVVPFRPAWWGSSALLVGDMKRGVAAFDAQTGARLGLLAADPLTAIPSRLAAWGAPGGGCGEGGRAMLAAATSSGRVHVFRAPL
ncbi:hypothetical protein Rsub_04330 [Raphidocelis subcapitata]|uniref:Uncharacterized protein n=1 Tax=Raphidocelis subcapitata TaxID=307507 RepID=A0A2V0P179_9CHLO|nr:hypothetical protein Rsub_04330 [Raphidocelis subcapitata]|eukprot:GBF91590.1 hypothetical protein Rsub_04330 [Raphidocelis subcapitata]